jgi:hypothetical protein
MNTCNYCKKEFKTPQILSAHMFKNKKCILSRGDYVSSKFKCLECDYIGVMKYDLQKHLEICKNYLLKKKEMEITSYFENKLINLEKELDDKNSIIKELKEQLKEKDNIIENYLTSKSESKKCVRKKTIPKTLRMAVWNRYIGKDVGSTKCVCCEMNHISQLDFECGHVIAECLGGTTDIENLKPICKICNNSMGKSNMNEFKQKYFLKS